MTAKLSDLHYALLATAAKRINGSVLPPSTRIGVTRAGLTRAINALIKRGYTAEADAADENSVWRTDGEQKIVAVITDAGRAAVAEADGKNAQDDRPTNMDGKQAQTESEPAAKSQTKQALVISMLQRKDGATLAQLVGATGWLPHTTRAALTGLRKKGRVITASKVDGVSLYRIQIAG